MPDPVLADAFQLLQTATTIVVAIATICGVIVAIWIAVKRLSREKQKEEITAAEGLVRLEERVTALEEQRTEDLEEYGTRLNTLDTRLTEIREQARELERRCVRHHTLVQEKNLEEVKKSVRRINERCDDIKDKIDSARERAEDRFVPLTQHEKDLATQVHALDALQQNVNNLSQLVGDIIRE